MIKWDKSTYQTKTNLETYKSRESFNKLFTTENKNKEKNNLLVAFCSLIKTASL